MLTEAGVSGAKRLAHMDRRSIWPPKLDLLGVRVSRTDYDEAVACVIAAAQERRPALVTAFPVYGVMTAGENLDFRRRIADFDLIAPDGQPVRLALNLLYRAGMRDRVAGPELMLRLCQRAAELGVAVYLYGSTLETVTKLKDKLLERHPGLQVAGCESPPFRALTPEEDSAVVDRISRSRAGIVFIGLGCPLQDVFAHDHRRSIQAVQVCVGAAFDFIAGTKRRAPRWMQDYALEWMFRLCQEPRRLFKRYVVCNTKFLIAVSLQGLGVRRYKGARLG